MLPDYDDLTKLTYLDAVWREAGRRYPAAAGAVKVTGEEAIDVGHYVIPANTRVWVPYYQMFRDDR
jgi:cytochrome P450